MRISHRIRLLEMYCAATCMQGAPGDRVGINLNARFSDMVGYDGVVPSKLFEISPSYVALVSTYLNIHTQSPMIYPSTYSHHLWNRRGSRF